VRIVRDGGVAHAEIDVPSSNSPMSSSESHVTVTYPPPTRAPFASGVRGISLP
jgi:hypothetical protein